MGRFVRHGIFAGLLALALADAIGTRLGVLSGAIPTTDGPWAWTSSRAAGVTAYLALALNVVLGLLLSTGAGDRWIPRGRAVEVHQWLSAATLAAVGAHAALLLVDGYVRFDALDVLVPLLGSYRPSAVALGVVATYLAIAVHASFALRKRIGVSAWRRVHHLTFLLFVLATAHGIFAGTDARLPWMTGLYVVSAGAVGTLLGLRLLGAPARIVARGNSRA